MTIDCNEGMDAKWCIQLHGFGPEVKTGCPGLATLEQAQRRAHLIQEHFPQATITVTPQV